jgi:hypothetical protein
MSGVRVFLLLIPIAASLVAQTEQNAVPNAAGVIDRAILGTGQSLVLAGTAMAPSLTQPALWPHAAAKCSVPLIEMIIAADKSFTIMQMKPPESFADRMAAAPEAPACPPAVH